ncbi:MAG: hypothetical protein KJO65_03130 [Gemmatimonadetes bacterium]|nr:hypothetical protein [Gemmatimonadota bacterium]
MCEHDEAKGILMGDLGRHLETETVPERKARFDGVDGDEGVIFFIGSSVLLEACG